MQLHGKNLIGSIPSATGNETFQAVDPHSGQSLAGLFHQATEAEVGKAVEKGEEAFNTYRSLPAEARARFLEAIGEEIMHLGDDLIDRCMAETALPRARLEGERGRTVNQLRLFARVVRDGWWLDARIDTADPERKPVPKPDVRHMHIPLGPVGVFGASNFPLAFSVAGGDTASALAAGCPVVVKGHPLHPGTSELVGRAILAAAGRTDMPEGVFSLVQGPSPRVGLALVEHPRITAIGFTGSFRGGKALFDAANRRAVPIPVFAEMGSSNPVFLLPSALKMQRESLAKGLTSSLNLGVGQFCTNPGMVVMERSDEADAFLEVLAEEIKPAEPGVMLSSGIYEGYQAGLKRLVESEGIRLLASGAQPGETLGAQSMLYHAEAATFLANPNLQEEVFGPATLSVQASHKEELIRLAEALDGHLTATVHGTAEELEEYADLIRILERKVGRLIFNGYPTGVEVCHSMVHGGPFPATTAPQSTSVGTAAIRRFARPVCYQDFPQASLPAALQNANPLGLWRLINGTWTKDAIQN